MAPRGGRILAVHGEEVQGLSWDCPWAGGIYLQHESGAVDPSVGHVFERSPRRDTCAR